MLFVLFSTYFFALRISKVSNPHRLFEAIHQIIEGTKELETQLLKEGQSQSEYFEGLPLLQRGEANLQTVKR